MIKSYTAVDLETTGLSPENDKILEIGAVKVVDGKVMDRYSVFVDAGRRIPPKIQELTGITEDMIVGGRKPEEAVAEFIEFNEGRPILGHNIPFDYGFLKQCAVNAGMKFETEGIDTLKIARKLLPDLRFRSLDYLCSYYRIDREHCHRAYDDALAAKELFERMAEAFYEGNEDVFVPLPLMYKGKKQSTATPKQIVYLNDLRKYHKIEVDICPEDLTKSEASRMIDNIIFQYGRIKRGE